MHKEYLKFVLLIAALGIVITTIWYSNRIVRELKIEERKKMELWAEATRQIEDTGLEDDINSIVFQVMQNNTSIPVILTNEHDSVITAINIDPKLLANHEKLMAKLNSMKAQHTPIEVVIQGSKINRIYYEDSHLLNELYYYPFLQLSVIFLFIYIAYQAFSASRNAEQNRVWVGMSKETAHQLGTPISALMAWVEYLRLKDDPLVEEVEKDIVRLDTIAERFSKIGSVPVLIPNDINEVMRETIKYLKSRNSKHINYYQSYPKVDSLFVPLNKALFEWVVENICKNAIDAMDGVGAIYVTVTDNIQVVYIDIQDTGKGISKSRFETVFKPGFTTKKHGWGLGLSLAKRIVENYHNGKIFIKSSEPGKGTTFRIVLRK